MNHRERARQIVASWPDWKRDYTLTEGSERMKNEQMTDLEWLARNVSEWPPEDKFILRESGRMSWLFSYDQETKELKAANGITKYVWRRMRQNLKLDTDYNIIPDKELFSGADDFTMSSAPEWDGVGECPIGAICEGHPDEQFHGFTRCRLVWVDDSGKEGVHKYLGLFPCGDDGELCDPLWFTDIRPLKSQEQRERDELKDIIEDCIDCDHPAERIAAELWSYGYRKQD